MSVDKEKEWMERARVACVFGSCLDRVGEQCL